MLCEEQTNVWNSICLNPSINRFVNCLALVTLICQIADLSWCINVYCVCQLFDLFVWGYLHLIGHFAGGFNHVSIMTKSVQVRTVKPQGQKLNGWHRASLLRSCSSKHLRKFWNYCCKITCFIILVGDVQGQRHNESFKPFPVFSQEAGNFRIFPFDAIVPWQRSWTSTEGVTAAMGAMGTVCVQKGRLPAPTARLVRSTLRHSLRGISGSSLQRIPGTLKKGHCTCTKFISETLHEEVLSKLVLSKVFRLSRFALSFLAIWCCWFQTASASLWIPEPFHVGTAPWQSSHAANLFFGLQLRGWHVGAHAFSVLCSALPPPPPRRRLLTSCFQLWSNSGIAPSEPPLSLSNDSSSSLSWSSLVIPSAVCLIRPRNTRSILVPHLPSLPHGLKPRLQENFIGSTGSNSFKLSDTCSLERETGSMSAAVKTWYLAHDHPMRIDSSWQLLWFAITIYEWRMVCWCMLYGMTMPRYGQLL